MSSLVGRGGGYGVIHWYKKDLHMILLVLSSAAWFMFNQNDKKSKVLLLFLLSLANTPNYRCEARIGARVLDQESAQFVFFSPRITNFFLHNSRVSFNCLLRIHLIFVQQNRTVDTNTDCHRHISIFMRYLPTDQFQPCRPKCKFWSFLLLLFLYALTVDIN